MNRRSDGFSLLEMIAVMAIMAILAGSLTPPLMRTLNDSYSTAEDNSLKAIADSFVVYVLQRKRIPSSTLSDWGDALAEVMSVAPTNITHNQNGFSRAVIYDPDFLTTSKTFSGYTQDLGLASQPVSPRLMIVSNLTQDIKTQKFSVSQFNDIWNQDDSMIIKESKNLKIERINLSPYFYNVLLTNNDDEEVGYSFDNGTVGSVPKVTEKESVGMVNRFVLKSTRVHLRFTPLSKGDVQTTSLVQTNLSFDYKKGAWTWSSQ